jgi:hypothetical protein
MSGTARRAAAQVDRGEVVDRLGRLGLIAKGVLYVVVAVLALQAAIGSGGETTGQEGAIQAIARQPFGTVLLVLLALGLLGYAVWRFAQAWFDTGQQDGTKGTVERVAYALRGVFYVTLFLFTVRLLTGSGGSGGGGGNTGGLMGLPLGRWLVGLAGLVTIGVGLYQGYKAVRRDFLEHLRTAQVTASQRRWAERLGILGLAARMVVFVLIGWFLVRAAVQFDPAQPVGLDAALGELATGPGGVWALGIVAAGLLAYGVFCIAVLARFGRLRSMD